MLGKTIQKSQVLGQSQMLEAERSTDPEKQQRRQVTGTGAGTGDIADNWRRQPDLKSATGCGSKKGMNGALPSFLFKPGRDLRQ